MTKKRGEGNGGEIMSKHTPGPWRVGYAALRVEAGSMNICDIRGWGHLTGKGALGLPEEEAISIQEANARLIAAAPEMLELLSDALKVMTASIPECPLMSDMREAIKKAEGQ